MRKDEKGMNMEKDGQYLTLTSGNGNPVPRIENWYGKLDVRKLNRRDYRELPGYVALDMKTGIDVIYPDIMTEPVLLVSGEVMEVIRRYEEEIPFLFVALFDTEREESAAYYCPVLMDGQEAQACGEALYRMETTKGSEIRIRLDLAESLLYRGAVGMGLEF